MNCNEWIFVKFGIHNEVLSRYGIIELRLVGYVDRHKIAINPQLQFALLLPFRWLQFSPLYYILKVEFYQTNNVLYFSKVCKMSEALLWVSLLFIQIFSKGCSKIHRFATFEWFYEMDQNEKRYFFMHSIDCLQTMLAHMCFPLNQLTIFTGNITWY